MMFELQSEQGFPLSMRVRVSEGASPNQIDLDNVRRHNAAVDAFTNMHTKNVTLRQDERTVFEVAQALEAVVSSGDLMFVNPFGIEYVIWPIFQALGNALDHSTGRIMCGMLSEWAGNCVESVGIDPETGAMK